MPHIRRLDFLRPAVLLAMACAGTVLAQPLRIGAAPAKDAQSVYVRDSGIAVEKLALAERMERLKEWDKSSDLYQEIIDKFADRVVPTAAQEAGQATQYTSVALVVSEKLARWPEEGLKVYRARYEDTAAALLTHAEDRALLMQIIWRYFATDASKSAGLRLIADDIERGDFASAAWVGKRLLTLHPTLIAERPGALFQTAVAQHLAGDTASARASLDELKTRFPDATGTVRGEDANLSQRLETALSTPPTLAKRFRSDSWPMQFGTPDAAAIPEHASAGGARLFSTQILPTPRGRIDAGNFKRYQQQALRDQKTGALTGIMPVVDNGELFFQDNARVYAINLSSGLPLAGWMQSHPGEKRGVFATDSVPTPRGKQLGITVTPQSVIAILGQSDFTVTGMLGMAAQRPQIVCLDRVTGKRSWAFTPDKIKFPDDLTNLKDAQFYGSPLVIDGSVYTLLRASRGGQFEECHVVSLRASDGAFQWASYIASVANTITMDFEGEALVGGVPAAMSFSDGRLFVQSNLGAMACLDAGDGKPLWINLYPRREGGIIMNARINRRLMDMAPSAGRPFDQNPPVVSDGRLFMLASDCPFIMVYDASSGAELRRIPRTLEKSAKSESVDMLLGVVDGQLVLANRFRIYVVPWRTFDETKTLLENYDANGTRYRPFAEPKSDPADGIFGRPMVTAKHIFVPTAASLFRITLDKTFRIETIYPAKGAWDDSEESPGNVVVTPDNVIIAGADHVAVYTDLAVATAKLDEQLSRDRTSVEPCLRYAELLIAAG
ncbi:MAG: PQQ-binding-like beta-propeller repeat protein, partial [Burkholderiales bacterium]|nr:PQQ-binding-like beta-propeller repeat protein [Phycisphaerae bacterium]